MHKKIKLKVCGMRDPENIRELAELRPDYVGFIFYSGSKRYVSNVDAEVLNSLPASIKKTGVFVNASINDIQETALKYNLDAIQLHGAETPEFCEEIKSDGLEVIKAFGIDKLIDFSTLNDYVKVVDYFLFDAKTPTHGGSGETFDWSILEKYELPTPYFLSGGLSLESLNDLKKIQDERLYAIDLNSRFEISPGLKDIDRLKLFFTTLKNSAIADEKPI